MNSGCQCLMRAFVFYSATYFPRDWGLFLVSPKEKKVPVVFLMVCVLLQAFVFVFPSESDIF